MKIVERTIVRIKKFTNRPWYIFFIAFLLGLDHFILILPADGLAITTFIGNKKRLWPSVVLVSLGSAFGIFILSVLIQAQATFITDRLFAFAFHSSVWAQTNIFFQKYGLWTMALSGALPIPQQPAAFVTALSGIPAKEIFLANFIGRLIKFSFYAWSVKHLPQLIRRILKKEHIS